MNNIWSPKKKQRKKVQRLTLWLWSCVNPRLPRALSFKFTLQVAENFVAPGGRILFEGIPTSEGIQELLFSLPRCGFRLEFRRKAMTILAYI